VNKEAREILDKFGKDLDKLDVKLDGKKSSDADKSPFRFENISAKSDDRGDICDEDFKTIMFKNAKHKNDKCLLLEKGSWN